MNSRVGVMGLSGVLALVMFGSLRFTPSATQDRLTAVPAHSKLVFSQESPDDFFTCYPGLGVQEDGFPQVWDALHSPLQPLFQFCENRPMAVATFGRRTHRGSWVAVSELGGPAATALRWRLLLFPPEGVVPARSYAVWPVWTFEHPRLPVWTRVRFAVTESLLICSISGDSHDIYRVLDAADGRSASMDERRTSP